MTNNGIHSASSNPLQVQIWWERWPDANVAIAMGAKSGLIAVDIDKDKDGFASLDEYEATRAEGPLPLTLMSVTGSGGRHMIYLCPNDGQSIPNRTNWRKGIDIRGDGGYIIAPPSQHESGGLYAWLNASVEPTTVPSDLLADVRAGGGSESGKPTIDFASIVAEGLKEGSRDDVLFRLACKERRLHANDPDEGRAVVSAIVQLAAAACDPPFPKEEALRKVASAYKQDHTDSDFPEYTLPADDTTGEGERVLRHLTDHGNAERLIDKYGDELRHNEAFGWMKWDGHKWQRVSIHLVIGYAREVHQMLGEEATIIGQSDADAAVKIRKWAHTSEAAPRINAAVNLAQSDSRVSFPPHEFDRHRNLLNCRNGIVDLRTGELMPHSRDLLMTLSTGIDFDPDFKLREWDEFLARSCQGDIELMAYMQRAAGYSLLGSTKSEVFFVLHGPGGTGKSTFIDGLTAAMGDYAMSTPANTLMMNGQNTGPPAHEIARMAGKRLVVASEGGEGIRLNESLVKQMTGGDRLQGRHLYQGPFEFDPQFTLWLATNHTPRVNDDAIFRRVKKVPFINQVPKNQQNQDLKEIIKDPARGGRAVLAWAVKGLEFFQKIGLAEPDRVLAETREYQQDQDRTGSFIRENLEPDPTSQLPLSVAYARYTEWSQNAGEKPLIKLSFATRIKDRSEITLQRHDREAYLIGWRLRTMLPDGSQPHPNSWGV